MARGAARGGRQSRAHAKGGAAFFLFFLSRPAGALARPLAPSPIHFILSLLGSLFIIDSCYYGNKIKISCVNITYIYYVTMTENVK